MGCGCGGRKNQVTKYRVTLPDGTVKDFLTRQEAEKERAEAGSTRPVQAVSVDK